MSDEPKRRSRAWIGWALIAAILLYPLSMGPAFRWASGDPIADPMAHFERVERLGTAYAPIVWLNQHFEWASSATKWYMALWEPALPPP